MYKRDDLEQYRQKGERVYVTFLDGEDQPRTVGGQIVQVIDDALILKIKTSSDYDRTIVIYQHRLIKLEGIRENRFIG